MDFSPKLKMAMEEIKLILEKNDIAGAIILHTPGFGEHFIKCDPSYSCAKFERDPQTGEKAIRIRAKLSDFNGDKKRHHRKLEDTVNMLSIITDLSSIHTINFLDLMDTLKETIDFKDTPGNHTDHDTLLN